MPNNLPKMSLPVLDDLFSSQEMRDDVAKEKIQDIPLSEIDNFPGHPFQVREDDEMQKMVESVKQYGVLNPVMVRPTEDGRYEMVSGHRRKRACEIAGIVTLPCLVREMTQDEAIIRMVDANIQRENILPSEKAMAYKMKLDAVRRQAGRPSRNSGQVDQNYIGTISRDRVADEAGESSKQIHRYIRLNELVPELLDMVDTKKMAFNPAVELSYLNPELQRELYDAMQADECTPSLSQAQRLKKFAQDGKLNRDGISLVMSEEKPQQKESFSFSAEQSKKYFPSNYTPAQKQQHIEKALEYYNRHLERKREEQEPIR